MSDRPEPFSSNQSAASHLQAGRDITIESISQSITTNQAKAEFFEPKLEQFKPPSFISPKVTPDLIKLLLDQNLLVLGESPDIDKAGLARHLAWCISEELQQRSTSGGQIIPIKEWYRSSDPQSLDMALQETERTTIFILPQILPQHVEQDLSRIQKVAYSNQHYVIVSTDTSFAKWKLSDSESKFLRKLSVDDLYSHDALGKRLLQELSAARKSLPAELLKGNLEPDLVIGNLTLQEVAERLKTPERIARFVELLCAEKESLPEEGLHELINLTQDNESILRRWFHTSLKPREQLLAIGLNFFDGLFDDQCLAAIGKLVEHEWHRRDPSLLALDYRDFHELHNFFRLIEIPTEKAKRFESLLPDQRQILFKIAWETYRLRLLTALPVLVELVKNSVGQKSFDRGLYGISVERYLYDTKLRCNQLRAVIGEAISDIGLIDSREVQETLLQLAAHKNVGVQAVAARAMARWREYGCDKEFFNTLKNLQRSKRRSEKQGEKCQDYISCTMALAVGYAARYDAPQGRSGSLGLSPELYNLLRQLSESPSRKVRHRLGFSTLPMVVSLHLVQLRDVLRDMTQHTDLIQYISESLRAAYLRNPEEVLNTLKLWYSECVQIPPQLPQFFNTKEISLREALLATVALTYGKIQCDKGTSAFTANEAFRYLRTIFLDEKHPFVRQAALTAICSQASQHFSQIERELKNLLPKLTDDERNQIIETLIKVYREQRQKVDGGNTKMAVPEIRLPVWMNLERSPTPMEEAMFRWLKSERNITAQMIGARLVLGERLNPKRSREVLKTLDLWYAKCVQTWPVQYEVLLAATALISLEMQCDRKTKKVVANRAFEYLHKILSKERHPFVRRTIIEAIRAQTDQRLQEIEPQLRALFNEFTDEERNQVVDTLTRVYQRSIQSTHS